MDHEGPDFGVEGMSLGNRLSTGSLNRDDDITEFPLLQLRFSGGGLHWEGENIRRLVDMPEFPVQRGYTQVTGHDNGEGGVAESESLHETIGKRLKPIHCQGVFPL